MIQVEMKLIKVVVEDLEATCEKILNKRESGWEKEEGVESASLYIHPVIDNYFVDVEKQELYKVVNFEENDFEGAVDLEEEEKDVFTFTAIFNEEEEDIDDLLQFAFSDNGDV
jgi:hypothetical protein